jgi:NAD(P)-dependent dehydrogenase (short-subunit alcohol dehydrogenase family)
MRKTLVTGASAGIGRATAVELARQGHRVVGVGRDAARLEEVAKVIGPAFVPLVLDLDHEGAPSAAIERASTALGFLDGMVVAHGVAKHVPIDALDAHTIDLHLGTNLRVPLLLAAAFARRAATPATLIFVTSTLGHKPAPTTTAYAASKAGLLAAAQALALELLPRGIRVATVSPGLIDTDMIRPLRLKPGEAMPEGEERRRREEEQQHALAALSPLGRLGQPDEIGKAIAYLFTSELAVGTNLVLDGGLTLR